MRLLSGGHEDRSKGTPRLMSLDLNLANKTVLDDGWSGWRYYRHYRLELE